MTALDYGGQIVSAQDSGVIRNDQVMIDKMISSFKNAFIKMLKSCDDGLILTKLHFRILHCFFGYLYWSVIFDVKID